MWTGQVHQTQLKAHRRADLPLVYAKAVSNSNKQSELPHLPLGTYLESSVDLD